MKRDFSYVSRALARWMILCAMLSGILFVSAGTTKLASVREYLAVFSAVLLVTMLAVDPQLARERAHPGPEATPSHLRLAAGFFFLLTLVSAAFVAGRLRTFAIAVSIRLIALSIFAISSFVQTWAMIMNPFFSPTIRLRRGHTIIDSGPYRFVRHPGYLAMCISVPASAVAIGSWLGLIPAAAFAIIIWHRAKIEDQFLTINLPGYAEYAQRVPSGLPLTRSA